MRGIEESEECSQCNTVCESIFAKSRSANVEFIMIGIPIIGIIKVLVLLLVVYKYPFALLDIMHQVVHSKMFQCGRIIFGS